jgi:hypothetical protein
VSRIVDSIAVMTTVPVAPVPLRPASCVPDPGQVPTGPPASGAPSPRMRVVRVLLLVQLVVALVTTVEATVVAAVGFGSPVAALLTAAVAVVLAVAARAVGRGRATWLVVAVQTVFLAAALVDVVISLVEVVAPLLVPMLVRIALPATVLVLVRLDGRDTRRAAPVGPVQHDTRPQPVAVQP